MGPLGRCSVDDAPGGSVGGVFFKFVCFSFSFFLCSFFLCVFIFGWYLFKWQSSLIYPFFLVVVVRTECFPRFLSFNVVFWFWGGTCKGVPFFFSRFKVWCLGVVFF